MATPKKKPTRPKLTEAERLEQLARAEELYRSGQFSDRELARQLGVSHTQIGRWVEAHGWEKDLAPAVRRATRRELLADAVAHDGEAAPGAEPEPNQASGAAPPRATPNARAREDEDEAAAWHDGPQPPTDEEIVAAATARGVDVVRSHRQDLRGLRGIVQVVKDRALEAIRTGEYTYTNAEGQRKTRELRLEELAALAETLAKTLHRVIPLERQAYSLDDPTAGADGTGTELTLDQARRMADEFRASLGEG